jgi:hypothetical protein
MTLSLAPKSERRSLRLRPSDFFYCLYSTKFGEIKCMGQVIEVEGG